MIFTRDLMENTVASGFERSVREEEKKEKNQWKNKSQRRAFHSFSVWYCYFAN